MSAYGFSQFLFVFFVVKESKLKFLLASMKSHSTIVKFFELGRRKI